MYGIFSFSKIFRNHVLKKFQGYYRLVCFIPTTHFRDWDKNSLADSKSFKLSIGLKSGLILQTFVRNKNFSMALY